MNLAISWVVRIAHQIFNYEKPGFLSKPGFLIQHISTGAIGRIAVFRVSNRSPKESPKEFPIARSQPTRDFH